MKKLLFFIIPLFLTIPSCSDDNDEYQCQSGDPNIVGARCNDGSRSDATGQGACSSHGGVDHWLCRD